MQSTLRESQIPSGIGAWIGDSILAAGRQWGGAAVDRADYSEHGAGGVVAKRAHT